ncbi:hypothetical protein CLOM_g18 [Closterium sp. NIES-68]|nr:hypothetical protein CLOM_g18 [Closterium sp. NIES-68]GJP73573.1 hypothetical protein CLOP_g4266 [Closterium sp. NIES-67]
MYSSRVGSRQLLVLLSLLALLWQPALARTKIGFIRRAASADGTRQVEEIYAPDPTPAETAALPVHVYRANDGTLVEEIEAIPAEAVTLLEGVPVADATAESAMAGNAAENSLTGSSDRPLTQAELDALLGLTMEDTERTAVRIHGSHAAV